MCLWGENVRGTYKQSKIRYFVSENQNQIGRLTYNDFFDVARYLCFPSLWYCAMVMFVFLPFVLSNVLCQCTFFSFLLLIDLFVCIVVKNNKMLTPAYLFLIFLPFLSVCYVHTPLSI